MHLQATASRAATLLTKNPGLFCRVMLAKLNTIRPMPPLPACRRIGDILFEYDLDDYRGTAPMYFGSYEVPLVETMKSLLRAGDFFIDVGANIGYLSAIAAGLVGTDGQVHCFEPVPAYFSRLQRLAELNPSHRILPNAYAAGEIPGSRSIYVTLEAGQSTLVPAYKTDDEIVSTLDVPVVRLDSYLGNLDADRVTLIKIDAEGFELPILKGLQGYFDTSSHRPAIICEIAPRAYPLMGRSLRELENFMSGYGYTARDLIDGRTPVSLTEMVHVQDVLFTASR